MGDVISLNQFRKNRDKQDAQASARENRVKFGQTKLQREADKAEREKGISRLDQKKLQNDTERDGNDSSES